MQHQAYKTSQPPVHLSTSQRFSKKMAYLIQPPAQSVDACNPLFTYSIEGTTRSEKAMILDFQDWGWEVSLHRPNDPVYLEAMADLDRAIKKRRRRTQLVFGDVVNDASRLTLEEIWEGEAMRRLKAGLYDKVHEVEGRREEHPNLDTVPEEQHVEQVAEVDFIPSPGTEADETQENNIHVSEDQSDRQVSHWYEHTTERFRQISKATNKRFSSPPPY
jgi:hypothetical protein